MPPVVVGIMWKLVFQPQAGVLNEMLYRAHLPGSNIDWLSDFKWALPAVILVGVWAGMPQTTVALLAGVQSIRDDLHEAAAVDGATALRRFWTITLPQLRPVIVAITTLDLIWNFNSFGLVYVLTQGGPGHSTELPMLFAYNEAFKYGEFGYAAALGNAMVARDRLPARLQPLGPAEGDAAVIVSSRPKTARHGAVRRCSSSTCCSSRSRCSGCSRSRSRAPRELVELHPSLIPSDPTLQNYRDALSGDIGIGNVSLLHAAWNSFKVAALTALLTTLVGAAGCVRAGPPARAGSRRLGLGWILLSQMFPLILIIIPLFLLLRKLHLTDSHAGLIFVYMVWTLPFILWMLQSYVRGIPRDLEEAAMVDGASRLYVLRTVIAPLLAPGIVVTALFAFITAWNEFFLALVLLQTPDLTTLPLLLARFVGIEGIVRLGPLAASALLATLPSLLLFTVIQRWLTRGLLSGAVKG